MTSQLLFQSIALLYLVATLGESGLGKILDYKGNLAYFQGQFKNSPLAGTTGLLLPVVTLMEVGSGGLAIAGLVQLWTGGGNQWGLWALCLGSLNFIALIFGLRMSKDYGGAAGVTPYLAVALIGLYGFLQG
ncbi:MAG: DoxX family protein [Saprospiraceae bacterium]|nr:DoxX family protein [Saprospiraceae bacterium]